MAKKPPTKAESDHMDAVAELGCIICHRPAEVHHLPGHGMRASHFHTIPLCPDHHRNGNIGVAVHSGRKSFEANFGTEGELLAKTLKLLEKGVL